MTQTAYRSGAPYLALLTTSLLLVGLPLMAAGGRAGPGGSGPAGVAEDLVRKRAELAREVEMLGLEVSLAKTRAAYAVLDPTGRKLLFRVRGRTMKEYRIVRMFVEAEPGSGDAALRSLYGRVYKLEDRIGKEIPVKLTGAVAEPDPRPQRGNAPSEPVSGAAMISPDPPPRYFWRLDNDVSIYVMEDKQPPDPWARQAEQLAARAKQLGRFWMSLTGRGPKGVVIYLVMEGEKSREAYRSLLPGLQSLILLTPRGPTG